MHYFIVSDISESFIYNSNAEWHWIDDLPFIEYNQNDSYDPGYNNNEDTQNLGYNDNNNEDGSNKDEDWFTVPPPPPPTTTVAIGINQNFEGDEFFTSTPFTDSNGIQLIFTNKLTFLNNYFACFFLIAPYWFYFC